MVCAPNVLAMHLFRRQSEGLAKGKMVVIRKEPVGCFAESLMLLIQHRPQLHLADPEQDNQLFYIMSVPCSFQYIDILRYQGPLSIAQLQATSLKFEQHHVHPGVRQQAQNNPLHL